VRDASARAGWAGGCGLGSAQKENAGAGEKRPHAKQAETAGWTKIRMKMNFLSFSFSNFFQIPFSNDF
jgi:hypothetical protein